jgi:hypothetical protein
MLYGKYKILKSKIREVETIRKITENISRAIAPMPKMKKRDLGI